MRPRKIYGLVVSETSIMLAGGLIIGLPLGYFATKWAMAEMTADLMYYDLQIAPEVYILTVLIALGSAVLASLVSARHITKEKLVDAIRERGAV
jgi:ABC-type antimicrobial peptide transport system permease subunit